MQQLQFTGSMKGNFNAKVGSKKHGKTVEPHTLQTRNEQEERLIN